jgi:hypothetical protein
MAVVQISRIQIRRGQANAGTGLPQLASGEMAWAIDAQQLYIGNGSVSEGAPAVGNTKILTQNDLSAQGNLIGLLQYVYKTTDTTIITGTSVNAPISRSLQQRLDNQTTTIEFGTAGDGSTDDTTALQRAINQLFLNTNNKASAQTASGTATRIKLEIPSGIYITTRPLYIPSYATLVGAGAEKTIISYNPTSTVTAGTINNSTTVTSAGATALMVGASITGTNIPAGATVVSVIAGVSFVISAGATGTGTGLSLTVVLNKPAIQFVNDTSTSSNYVTADASDTLGVYAPRRINISEMTIKSISGQNTCIQLDSVRDSVFENINLDGASVVNTTAVGIQLNAVSSLVTCERNLFKNVSFNNFYYGIFSKRDILNNTFVDCNFSIISQGVVLGEGADGVTAGQVYGPRETQIINSKFYNVKQQGVLVIKGTGNAVQNCRFINVGANGGGIATVTYPIIFFGTIGNTAEKIYTDRADNLLTGNITVPYIPEVSGKGIYNSFSTHSVELNVTDPDPTQIFRLPMATNQSGTPTGTISYKLDYNYASTLTGSNAYSRRGTLTIVASRATAKIQMYDEFDFASATDNVSVTTPNSVLLEFSAEFLDQVGGSYTASAGQVPTTISIRYSNTLASDAGTLNYSYRSQF